MKITEIHNVPMPPVSTSTPKSSPPKGVSQPLPPDPSTFPKCRVVEQPDGGLQVSFLIEEPISGRIRRRANGMPLERWLWENILNRAVTDAVY